MENYDLFLFIDWDKLFEKRIANTLITLIVGGLILKWISDKRTKRDKIREKSIEFLDEISMDLNSVISLTFGSIRRQQYLTEHSELTEKRGKLFTKRFKVRINGEALLNDKDFSKKYGLLIWEIYDLTNCLFVQKDLNEDELMELIKQRISRLEKEWEIKEGFKSREKLTPVFQNMLHWNEMIYERAISLLTSNMKRLK